MITLWYLSFRKYNKKRNKHIKTVFLKEVKRYQN